MRNLRPSPTYQITSCPSRKRPTLHRVVQLLGLADGRCVHPADAVHHLHLLQHCCPYFSLKAHKQVKTRLIIDEHQLECQATVPPSQQIQIISQLSQLGDLSKSLQHFSRRFSFAECSDSWNRSLYGIFGIISRNFSKRIKAN